MEILGESGYQKALIASESMSVFLWQIAWETPKGKRESTVWKFAREHKENVYDHSCKASIGMEGKVKQRMGKVGCLCARSLFVSMIRVIQINYAIQYEVVKSFSQGMVISMVPYHFDWEKWKSLGAGRGIFDTT